MKYSEWVGDSKSFILSKDHSLFVVEIDGIKRLIVSNTIPNEFDFKCTNGGSFQCVYGPFFADVSEIYEQRLNDLKEVLCENCKEKA